MHLSAKPRKFHMRSPQKFYAKSSQILNFLKACFWVLDKFPRGEYSCHNNFTPLLRSSPTETMIEARRTSVLPSTEQELRGRKGPPPKLRSISFCGFLLGRQRTSAGLSHLWSAIIGRESLPHCSCRGSGIVLYAAMDVPQHLWLF